MTEEAGYFTINGMVVLFYWGVYLPPESLIVLFRMELGNI
jgi:hypothetical protein